MDIAQINSILDSLEEYYNNADESVIKAENKILALAAITDYRNNPTLEGLTDFVEVLSEYTTFSTEDTKVVTPVLQTPQYDNPDTSLVDTSADDQKKLQELLEKLRNMNQNSVQE